MKFFYNDPISTNMTFSSILCPVPTQMSKEEVLSKYSMSYLHVPALLWRGIICIDGCIDGDQDFYTNIWDCNVKHRVQTPFMLQSSTVVVYTPLIDLEFDKEYMLKQFPISEECIDVTNSCSKFQSQVLSEDSDDFKCTLFKEGCLVVSSEKNNFWFYFWLLNCGYKAEIKEVCSTGKRK